MRVIYEHRVDIFVTILYLSFSAPCLKHTGLIPDLQDADPVCTRLQNIGNLG